eukprot:scaffold117178_cov32-Prasinocladus_malaysianus.AAC.4
MHRFKLPIFVFDALTKELWGRDEGQGDFKGKREALWGAGAAVDWTDRWGRTPLHWAVVNGHVECCKVLLEAGAKPNFGGHSAYRHHRLTSLAQETPAQVICPPLSSPRLMPSCQCLLFPMWSGPRAAGMLHLLICRPALQALASPALAERCFVLARPIGLAPSTPFSSDFSHSYQAARRLHFQDNDPVWQLMSEFEK